MKETEKESKKETKKDAKKETSQKASVKLRLRKSYVVIMLLMDVCILLAIIGMAKISIDYRQAIVNYGFSQGYVGQLGIQYNTMTTRLRNIMIVTDTQAIQTLESQISEDEILIDQYYNQVRDAANTDEEFALLDEMNQAFIDYREVKEDVITLAKSNKNTEAFALLQNKGIVHATTIREDIDQILEINIEKCHTTMSDSQIMTVIFCVLLLAAGVLSAYIGMTTSKKISDSICIPLGELTAAADKLKVGELDITITHESDDELGELASSFKEACSFMQLMIEDTDYMLDGMAQGNFGIRSKNVDSYVGKFASILESLRQLRGRMVDSLGQMREAADNVDVGANQMAESAQALAQGATDQASAVEELLATAEDVTRMVNTTAAAASDSYKQTLEYAQTAEQSSEAMQELTQAMNSINETANRIGNIIAEIEDIASQTNLLSLNAAIEAARAGEAGKGFAVVADQISKLAADSAQSAVNTKKLIEETINEIDHGNHITARTSQVLDQVVDGMKRLGDNAKESSEQISSQAEAIHQIEIGIQQISTVVQNNSASAQEVSATSEELLAQAETLDQEIQAFQL